MSLNFESGFSDLVQCFTDCENEKWNEWLELNDFFPKMGKQGFVGTMKIKNNNNRIDSNSENNFDFKSGDEILHYYESNISKKKKETGLVVFKMSQHINYLIRHEGIVMKSLNELASYCPHFCKLVGDIVIHIDPFKKMEENPFKIETKYPIEKDVILIEYIRNSRKFCSFIKSTQIKDGILFSIIKQVLMAITVAQQKKNFTHYDLHSDNIMIKKCSKDLVFLYVLDKKNQFCIPTFGYYPIIIDFGFSYTKDLEHNPMWPSLCHTDCGFMGISYDKISDHKLFLTTVSKEFEDYRKKTFSQNFLKKFVKYNYSCLNIEWDSGWDANIKHSISDYVVKEIERCGKLTNFFREYTYYFVDIIQTLIDLPLEKGSTYSIKNFNLYFTSFMEEFSKIEKQIGSMFYCLYILQGITDSARQIKKSYTKGDLEEKQKAVEFFRFSLLERLDSISKFCVLKNLEYEKMLCSLFCLIKSISSIFYKKYTKRKVEKEKLHENVAYKTSEEIFSVLEMNVPHNYIFTKDTTIIVLDSMNENADSFTLKNLPEQIILLNELESISQGTELYEIYERMRDERMRDERI